MLDTEGLAAEAALSPVMLMRAQVRASGKKGSTQKYVRMDKTPEGPGVPVCAVGKATGGRASWCGQ